MIPDAEANVHQIGHPGSIGKYLKHYILKYWSQYALSCPVAGALRLKAKLGGGQAWRPTASRRAPRPRCVRWPPPAAPALHAARGCPPQAASCRRQREVTGAEPHQRRCQLRHIELLYISERSSCPHCRSNSPFRMLWRQYMYALLHLQRRCRRSGTCTGGANKIAKYREACRICMILLDIGSNDASYKAQISTAGPRFPPARSIEHIRKAASCIGRGQTAANSARPTV